MGRTTYKTAPKGGLYTRLSVDDGITDRESNSITSQKQMLMQYAQYHGIEVWKPTLTTVGAARILKDRILSV